VLLWFFESCFYVTIWLSHVCWVIFIFKSIHVSCLKCMTLPFLDFFTFLNFFQKPPGSTWIATKRHMCLNPVFWVSLWTAWRLRATHQATYTLLPSFPWFVWFISGVVVFELDFIVLIRLSWQDWSVIIYLVEIAWILKGIEGFGFMLGLEINKHEICLWMVCCFMEIMLKWTKYETCMMCAC